MPFASIIRSFAVFFLLAGIGGARPLTTPRLSSEVGNTGKTTTIITKVKGRDEATEFRIDWLSGNEAPRDFRNVSENGVITSTHRFGDITVTRTILADDAADCVLIHVVADRPGVVSLDARFVSEHPAKILNRREILLSTGKSEARAWILPFESDVHSDAKGKVSLHGEGEALIILNLTADPDGNPISGTLERLGAKYDPGHDAPNPHRIWEGAMGTGGMNE